MREKAPLLVLAFCLLLFSGRAWSSLVQESATFDETSYFGLGRYLLENQRWDVRGSILHPPLSFYLQSIPLWFDMDTRAFRPALSPAVDPMYLASVDVPRGQTMLSSPANGGDRLLAASRLVTVTTGALLGWFVYAWSYALYGPWSAMLAVVLYTFCPNILAHARLITPDITVTTFSFVSVYLLWRFLRDHLLRHAIAGGVCFGLALLAKFTGALLIPLSMGLMLLSWATRRQIDLRGCALFFCIGFAVLSLGYGTHLEPYFAGITFQLQHARDGHASFLMGEHSDYGWWYYFLVAFALKTPIATITLLGMALVRFAFRARKGAWIDEAFLLIPAAVVLGFFSMNPQSIGLRYVLPIYPFLFVIASEVARVVAARALYTGGLVAALVSWLVLASWSIHPHYLAYFNELIGGPSNGYKYLVDSNLDWGQGLKGLKRFMEANAIPEIGLSYFGTDSPARYGIQYRWLPSHVLNDPNAGRPSAVPQSPLEWVAISATNLQGVYLEDKALFEKFARRPPVATIGYSIFVYHVDE